jgi:hypothetical protein
MESKHYVAVSAVLSIASAIFFRFWGDSVYVGTILIVAGFLIVAAGQTFLFVRAVSLVAIGLLLVSGGVGLLSTDGQDLLRAFASVMAAGVAGFAVIVDSGDSRDYGRRAGAGIIIGVAAPMAVLHYAEYLAEGLALSQALSFSVTLICMSAMGSWLVHDASDIASASALEGQLG